MAGEAPPFVLIGLTMQKEDSGVIRVEHGVVSWHNSTNNWRVPCDRIAVIGEWINDDGVSISNLLHEIVIVDIDTTWFIAPVASEGLLFFNREICQFLPECDVSLELFGTARTSRIIWPRTIRGEDLLVFSSSPRRTMYAKILSLFANQLELRLSPAAIAEIERRRQRP